MEGGSTLPEAGDCFIEEGNVEIYRDMEDHNAGGFEAALIGASSLEESIS